MIAVLATMHSFLGIIAPTNSGIARRTCLRQARRYKGERTRQPWATKRTPIHGGLGRGGQVVAEPVLWFRYTGKTEQNGFCPTICWRRDFQERGERCG